MAGVVGRKDLKETAKSRYDYRELKKTVEIVYFDTERRTEDKLDVVYLVSHGSPFIELCVPRMEYIKGRKYLYYVR